MTLLIALSVTAALVQTPTAPTTGSVSGIVVEDGSGTPVADAVVTLMPVRSGPVVSSRFEEPPRAHTDREGRFQIGGLSPGRYHAAAQKMGYASAFGPNLGTPLEISAGENRTLSLSLQRGAVIVGRVLTENGEPLVNLRVTAMRQAPAGFSTGSGSSAGLIPAGPGMQQTNDLGEFRLYGLPPGDYYVQALPMPDFGRAAPTSARTTTVPTFFPGVRDLAAAQTITVGPGQTSDAIEIRMINSPAFLVSGVVVDEAGRPVPNAMVRLDPDPASGPFFRFGPHLQARTDASGTFTITNVTTATYTLVAIPPLTTSAPTGPSGGGMSVFSSGGSGSMTGGVTEEVRNGVATQYRDDFATKAQLSVNQADVTGVQIIVKIPR